MDPKDPDTRMSPMRKKRHCHWNTRTHFNEKILQIRRYNARLDGDDIHVLQHLMATTCAFKDPYCIPVEQANSPIIWDSWTRLQNLALYGCLCSQTGGQLFPYTWIGYRMSVHQGREREHSAGCRLHYSQKNGLPTRTNVQE